MVTLKFTTSFWSTVAAATLVVKLLYWFNTDPGPGAGVAQLLGLDTVPMVTLVISPSAGDVALDAPYTPHAQMLAFNVTSTGVLIPCWPLLVQVTTQRYHVVALRLVVKVEAFGPTLPQGPVLLGPLCHW
jgi:hypothetical protein